MMLRMKTWIAGLAFGLLLLGSGVYLAADYEEEFQKTLPLKAGDRFSLNNVNGDVRISTWKESKVEIKALKIAERDEEDLKEVEIQVEEFAGAVSVKTIWPKWHHNLRVRVEYDILVPEGVDLKAVETVNGDVELTGPYGRIGVETTNGTIEVNDASGELNAETTNGAITVYRFAGRIDVETTNGGIRLEGLTFKDGISAETTNGSISIRLESPEKVNALLRAETTNGHITVDFPVTLKNLHKSRHLVEAQVGEGGPEISLSTTNGSIKITK